jgi:two-component system NtrC family sensor kinase
MNLQIDVVVTRSNQRWKGKHNLSPYLLSSSDFLPRGFCYYWNHELVWLHMVSDGLIAFAYFSIPITLLYFVRKKRDVPFNWIFICFGALIVACGATHVMEIWNLWHANYWAAGVVKAITAAASVSTAILLVNVVPMALVLPDRQDLKEANQTLQEQTAKLQELASFLDVARDSTIVRDLDATIGF